MPDDQLMSIKELAHYLKVNVTTIYLWSNRGKIPAIRVGNLWRYRRSDIDDWLNAQRNQAVEPEAATPGTK
jgi:PTS system nitrogen regulatory IIA component